jgi:hypothetical protein
MRFLSLFLVFAIYSSCDYCSTIDCSPGALPVAFRLLNQTGDTDLVFGPTSSYDKDSIRFYTLHDLDTIELQYQPRVHGNDSVLEVNILLETVTDVYMELNALDTDTFHVTYRNLNEKCCGAFTQIDSLRYNYQPPFSMSQRFVELRK